MLLNLKAEYVRQNIDPCAGIMKCLGCSEKTARNKLNGITAVTVPEAKKILDTDFAGKGFTIEYLFAETA